MYKGSADMLRPEVESILIKQVKEKHPEYSSLTATAIIDIALRRLIQN
jgi:hypothetical protein